MYERNANECEDRIRVYSHVVLRCDEGQHEGDAVQGIVLYCEPTITSSNLVSILGIPYKLIRVSN